VQELRGAVGDVPVGQADAEDARSETTLGKRLPDRAAEPAHEHALLDGDEQVVLGRELGEQAGVQRLGEAGVGDGDVEPAVGE
jgi:hypothetical protein